MYQRIGAAAYKKDLGNTIALLEVLGNPQNKFQSVHVGGTNGKGSVSNLLASVCCEAGYNTGLYTSPHLEDFRERIRVNGHCVDEEFVIAFVQKMIPHIEKIAPSFFEITVAMAFEYFAYRNVEIAIVEVGLGGRLDSTNVILPKLSVITNISFDHMQMLGNSLPEIAAEKAGIIKPLIPVVIGESSAETIPVFEQQANKMQAGIYVADENISVEMQEDAPEGMVVDVSVSNSLVYPGLVSGLHGDYQLKNIATAIQAIEVLRSVGLEVPEDAIYDGFRNVTANTGFAGRWQFLQSTPLVIADCAHNEAGVREVFRQMEKLTYRQLHLVTGTVNDKDLKSILSRYPQEATYYFCCPDIPRGLPASALAEQAAGFGLLGRDFPDVQAALASAMANAGPSDVVLICGSIFVVAEAIAAYKVIADKH